MVSERLKNPHYFDSYHRRALRRLYDLGVFATAHQWSFWGVFLSVLMSTLLRLETPGSVSSTASIRPTLSIGRKAYGAAVLLRNVRALDVQFSELQKLRNRVRIAELKRPREVLTEVVCPACDSTGFQKVKQPTQTGRKIYPPKCTECCGKGRIKKPAAT